MSIRFVIFITVISCATSRHLPRYADLDDEDKLLFRAAYDTPSYDHDEYQEPDDLPIGKLDLMKDGMWAIKAKLKELKAFDKSLAANMLATKLKLKELLESKDIIKKHHHVESYDKKPYGYQAPSSYQHYEPQYPPAGYGHDPYYGH